MTNAPLIFLGAGASAPFDIPPMKQMVSLFEKHLTEKGLDEQVILWKDVKTKSEKVYGEGNVDIEHMLTFFSSPFIDPSRLTPSIIYHYGVEKKERIQIVGMEEAESVIDALKTFIYARCNIQKHEKIFPIYSKFWRAISQFIGPNVPSFYTWASLEVFTTNYDRCFEIFYRMARNHFSREIILDVGEKGRYYNFDDYNQQRPRLYKLHGSIRRYTTKADKIRLYDAPVKKGGTIDGDEVVKEWMIWPLMGKYIYQHPFSRLMDKFRKALLERNTWLFVGFSFRDEGINLILKDVNDRLRGRSKRGTPVQRKQLILIDRSAEAKRNHFKQYEMIQFWPINGDFGEIEVFDKLRETHKTHKIFE